MRSRVAWTPWAAACLGPVLLAAAVVLDSRMPNPGSGTVSEVYPNFVLGTMVPLLGALVLSRLPGHPIGRLFLCCGLASAFTIWVYGYAQYGLVDFPGSVPLALAAGWVSSWVWLLGFMPLATVGVLVFPDGRLPSRRWRPVLAAAVTAPLLGVLTNAFRPGPLENHPARDNPLGLPLPSGVFAVTGGVAMTLFVLALVGSTVAALARWRHATGAEREQLRWFALAALLLAVAVLPPWPAWLGDLLTVVVLPLLPLAVAVAILREHLFGIEVVVRRSLVYGALTVLLLVGYAAVATVLGLVLQGPGRPGASLAATAVVAVGFTPLRARLQRSADRLVYGDRGDPYAVLTGIGRRLDVPVGGDDGTLAEVAETVASSLRLPYVQVEVCAPGSVDDAMVAATGTPTGELHEVPLTFRGQRVGTLLAAPRTPQDPFRAADLRLLDDLGRQVAVAAHAMLLGRDLQRSRERIVSTREEERRRIRRDLHDGLGPVLAGVALGLDALGRHVAQRPDEAVRLAATLKEEVQVAITDVRRLVEDLRPPALDQLGLVAALEQHATLLTERDPGLDVAVAAVDVPPLPAAVEVAAYRILTEALNNVAKHADAREARVDIGVEHGSTLVLRVQDDGVGLAGARREGVGLPTMRERATELGGSCEATTAPGGGTLVAARIPMVAS